MEDKPISKQWEEEITLIKKNIDSIKEPQTRIAFYGSSSIRLWNDIAHDLYPHKPINMGFGGSTYKDCNAFFTFLFSYFSPAGIVLYSGDNDIANGEAPENILQDVTMLTTQIRLLFPHIPLAVISIKPSPARRIYLNQITDTNQLIKNHLAQIGGEYIDIFTPMLTQSGQPNEALFSEDELHLNDLGYQLWAGAIRNGINNYYD